MADSNGGDHPEGVSVSELGRPESPSTGGRRAYWWTGAAIVVVGAVVTGLLAASSSKDGHRPVTMPSGTPSTGLHLPSSATHDAHGLILTLPGIGAVIGETPLPGMALSGDVLSHENRSGVEGHSLDDNAVKKTLLGMGIAAGSANKILDGIKAVQEAKGTVATGSKFLSFVGETIPMLMLIGMAA